MGQNKNISPQAESIVSRRSTQKYADSTCFVFWADSADPVFDWEQIPQTLFCEISATDKGSSAKTMTVKRLLPKSQFSSALICEICEKLNTARVFRMVPRIPTRTSFCLCGQIASAAGSSHRNDGSWLLLH